LNFILKTIERSIIDEQPGRCGGLISGGRRWAGKFKLKTQGFGSNNG
jgi:hypothetical protein